MSKNKVPAVDQKTLTQINHQMGQPDLIKPEKDEDEIKPNF